MASYILTMFRFTIGTFVCLVKSGSLCVREGVVCGDGVGGWGGGACVCVGGGGG